jgi:hypothetical protein
MKRAALLLLLSTVAVAANFAAVDGFSGRTGFDCTSCHNQPIQDDAIAILEGLPGAWNYGVSYTLTVRVEGGPIANPIGPQGGFEMDSNGGTFAIPAEFDGLLRLTDDGATYLPDGTFMREWNVIWNAPSLSQQPFDVSFWLAAVSANGNHDARTNTSVQGEFGDSVATLQLTIPASTAAVESWAAIPLTAPTTSRAGGLITGDHTDKNATGIRYSIAGGDWIERATGQSWRIETDASVEVYSVGSGRVSDAVAVEGVQNAPWPMWPVLLLFLVRRK